MKLQILGCAGGMARGRRLSSYLIDGRLLVDAGALGAIGPDELEAVLLTHAHLDHVLSYPMLLTSRLASHCETLEVHASADTWRRLRKGLLSDLVYPDHTAQSTLAGHQVARTHTIDGPFEVQGYQVTPLPMVHAYPCLAFAIRKGAVGVIVGGDTSDSRPLWRFASENRWVKHVLVEVSFADGLEELSHQAGHLTPSMLEDQLRGFRRRSVQIHVIHVKPELHGTVRRELRARLGDRVRVARDGQTLTIG